MTLRKLFKLLILLLFFCGCSLFNNSSDIKKKEIITDLDYVQHYKYLGESYLNSTDINVISLTTGSKSYLNKVFQRLVQNNEALLKTTTDNKFFIVNNPTPFVFSLPGNLYFYSSGLFLKHMKSEELFVATFAAEIIKSQKNIYEKRLFIPLGFMTTEKMLMLTRLKSEYKKRINEWSYQVLKRAGYDGTAYLNWIQVQNRNSIDFALYLGEASTIMTEEQSFKNFISSQGIMSIEKKLKESNSSKEYYELLQEIAKDKNEGRTIRKNSGRRII